MVRIRLAFIVVIMVLFVQGSVYGCPMCQGQSAKKTVKAYKGITLFLALMPIGGCSAISYWLYNKNKKH